MASVVPSTLRAPAHIQDMCLLLLSAILVNAFGYGYSLAPIAIVWSFPHFIIVNTYFLTESIFTSFLILSIAPLLFLRKSIQEQVPGVVACCGILMGLCALIRPTMEYFPIFVFLASFLFYYFKIFLLNLRELVIDGINIFLGIAYTVISFFW